MSSDGNTDAIERFSQFFTTWILQHELNLQQLLSVPKDPSHEQDQKEMVSKFMNHYKQYYAFKWTCVKEDVLCFFYPPWLTNIEIENNWMTGFKPLLAFPLVNSLRHGRVANLPTLSNMPEEQLQRMKQLRIWTGAEQEKLEVEMERLHMAVGHGPMVELSWIAGRVRNGDPVGDVTEQLEVSFKNMLVGLQRIVKIADCIRMKTLKGVVDILTPLQAVEFLSAVSMLQIQTRRLGSRAVKPNQ